jgi:hypothetical protein
MSKLSSESIAKMKEAIKAAPSVLNPELDTVFVAPIGVPMPETGFTSAAMLYPARAGGINLVRAERQWIARINEGCTRDEMIDGVKRYAAYCAAKGIVGTHRVKAAEDFFGRYQYFKEAWDAGPSKTKSERVVIETQANIEEANKLFSEQFASA